MAGSKSSCRLQLSKKRVAPVPFACLVVPKYSVWLGGFGTAAVQSLWAHLQRPRSSDALWAKQTMTLALLGREGTFIFNILITRHCPPPTRAGSRVPAQPLARCFPPARCFLPLLKYAFPEVPLVWMGVGGCPELRRLEPSGTGHVRPRAAPASPHGGARHLATPYRCIFVETLQAPQTCELLFILK